jgi:hypothetical protein
VHGLIAPMFDVIALAIILILIGLAVFRVFIIATRMIVTSVVSMIIAELLVTAIALVALIIVPIFVATMLLVAQFTAAHDRKMSRTLLFLLRYVLVDLLKNASPFVSHLTLIRKSNELERVCWHCLVPIRKLRLMRLGLRKEDLFTLLLRHGYLRRLGHGPGGYA